MPKPFNSFSCCFRSKDTSDSSESSNESQSSGRDFTRREYARKQQEASSSPHAETSDYSPDKLLPSKRMMKLENGTYASGDDIERIENLRFYADPLKNFFSGYKKEYLIDLEKKCKDPNHQLSSNSYSDLERRGLINKWGEPNDSVKNIVRDLSERICLFDADKPVATQVKLRNGTEVHYKLAEEVTSLLQKINDRNPKAVSDLHMLCKDPNHVLNSDTANILQSKGLIDGRTGQPRDSVKNIVLCSFDEESRQLRSPAMPMDELLIMLEKTTPNDEEKKILVSMYPHQYRFEPLKPSAHTLDQLLPSEQEVRLGNGTYASAMDIKLVDEFMRSCEFNVEYNCRDRKNACKELLNKCKDATYQISYKSHKILRGVLINEQGEPSDSVKKIMLCRFEQNRVNTDSNTVEQVKLRNGTEVCYPTVCRVIRNLDKINDQAVSDLHMLCKDPNHVLKGDTTQVLKSKGLIDKHTGQPCDSVKNIVLCSFDEESRQLRLPTIPFDELEEEVRKNLHKRIEEKAQTVVYEGIEDSAKEIRLGFGYHFEKEKKILEYIYPRNRSVEQFFKDRASRAAM
jgi:hypothetical protein